jgi:hypothetical protein
MYGCPTESSPFWSMSGVTFTKSRRFHLSFGQILANFTQIFETLWLVGFRLFDALKIPPTSV